MSNKSTKQDNKMHCLLLPSKTITIFKFSITTVRTGLGLGMSC